MKISFYGKFVRENKERIEKVAEERGHKVGRPAAIVFMMSYPNNIENVARAHKRGGFVVILSPVYQTDVRAFFKAGAYDVVDLPASEDEVRKMFADLETRMAKIFGGS